MSASETPTSSARARLAGLFPAPVAIRKTATAAVTATRRTGPRVLRELLRRSPLVWRGFSPGPPAVQVDVAAPPAEVAAGAPTPARGVTAALAGRWIPSAALLACVLGVVALAQPVLEAGNGMVSFTLLDVPYLGMSLLVGFVVLTLLPLIDLSRRRTAATRWLLLPALLGALPVGVGTFALESIPRGIRALWASAPATAVQIGPAAALLVAADITLILIAGAAIATRARARLRWTTS